MIEEYGEHLRMRRYVDERAEKLILGQQSCKHPLSISVSNTIQNVAGRRKPAYGFGFESCRWSDTQLFNVNRQLFLSRDASQYPHHLQRWRHMVQPLHDPRKPFRFFSEPQISNIK